MTNKSKSEAEEFLSVIKQRHRRINPCFMTGKGCVHTEHVDEEWENRNRTGDTFLSFMVRPFKSNVEAFFELCLERYILQH